MYVNVDKLREKRDRKKQRLAILTITTTTGGYKQNNFTQLLDKSHIYPHTMLHRSFQGNFQNFVRLSA
jgi:hypothetical protein